MSYDVAQYLQEGKLATSVGPRTVTSSFGHAKAGGKVPVGRFAVMGDDGLVYGIAEAAKATGRKRLIIPAWTPSSETYLVDIKLNEGRTAKGYEIGAGIDYYTSGDVVMWVDLKDGERVFTGDPVGYFATNETQAEATAAGYKYPRQAGRVGPGASADFQQVNEATFLEPMDKPGFTAVRVRAITVLTPAT